MKTTTFITDQHPMAPYVAVIDAEGNVVKKVKSYNTETQEVTVYVTNDKGQVIVDWPEEGNKGPGQVRTETKILEGSKLVFRDVAERQEEGTSIEVINSVTTEQLDLININAYRRALMFLEGKDGIGKIYDEIDALSKKYSLGWTDPRTEADDKEETYKRKLVPSLDEVIMMNRLYNSTFDSPIHNMEEAIKAKLAEIYNTGMEQTEENSDMPGYSRKSVGVEVILRDGIVMGLNAAPKSESNDDQEQHFYEAQLGQFTDNRQYQVEIITPGHTNGSNVILDIDATGKDAATIYSDIIQKAIAERFPGNLSFDPSNYRFVITRL